MLNIYWQRLKSLWKLLYDYDKVYDLSAIDLEYGKTVRDLFSFQI